MNKGPESVDRDFIEQLNTYLGIVHKVSRLYFGDSADREDVMQEMMHQLSCVFAIREENKKSFRQPLAELQLLIDDFGASKI